MNGCVSLTLTGPEPDLVLGCTLESSILVISNTQQQCHQAMVSFEVLKHSPQPLKARIVATAAFRRFLEFSMYSQRCIIAGSVVACLGYG